MKLLDRYLTRNFLQAYFYCVAAFLSIWLIFDISDSISLFIENNAGPLMIARFYATQAPQILIILLPVALLLALLFVLARMSRANEIVSMLTSGISLTRVLAPVLLIGLLTSALCFALNYSAAPHADLARKNFFATQVSRSRDGEIFRNRRDSRTWFIQHYDHAREEFLNVEILQQDASDHITTAYFAPAAHYVAADKSWLLTNAKVVHYDNAGNIAKESIEPSVTVRHWTETPYRVRSANLRPDVMSLPELSDYLRLNSDFPATQLAPFRTHFYYRMALPWTCFVIVLIAAPLGVGFSRRGIIKNVALAIVLTFVLNFASHLFLALGEGDRVPAWIGGWAPILIFGAFGFLLFRLRAANRDPSDFRDFRRTPILAQ
ncbi:MAG: LptF/LptG family permease [Verrucomicrobiota bacterium]|nr:LptF/LptG family permease [Verrucomicrobiota bacterium]